MKETLYISESFESYPTIIDGYKGLIRVDLKAQELKPEAIHTYYLRLPYIIEDGMDVPDEKELNRLSAQTLMIEEALLKLDKPVYAIGSLMFGKIDTLIYVSEVEMEASELFDEALASIGIKHYAAGAFINDQWSFYQDNLYPSIYDINTINNRNKCRELETLVNPTIAWPIHFTLGFETIEKAQSFLKEISVAFELVNSQWDEMDFKVIVGASIVPSFQNMNMITQTLIQAANISQGQLLDWQLSEEGSL